jgi:hypothetical protein
MSQEDFEIAGVVLQLLGGAYIVYASGRTWSRLTQFAADVTYNELGPLLNALRNELAGQFMHQTLGFAMLVLGGLAQLVAATW